MRLGLAALERQTRLQKERHKVALKAVAKRRPKAAAEFVVNEMAFPLDLDACPRRPALREGELTSKASQARERLELLHTAAP